MSQDERMPQVDPVLARLRAGDEAAFRDLVRRHHAVMIGLASTFVTNRATAEEAVQETWLAVILGLERFEGRSSLKSWVFAILVNKARTRATRDGRVVTFAVDGKQLYTWCALDTLFLPAVIGRPARVESSCAATGLPVRLAVDPDAGVTALEPATAVVSIVTPEGSSSVRASFCNPGRFFATRDAARDWQAKHPGMEVLSVVDAYHAGRSLSAMLLGGSTSHACCAS